MLSWIEGLTRNCAQLGETARDPRLRPLLIPLAPAEAAVRAAEFLGRLPRWQVVTCDAAAGVVHATHTTRLWRFLDDIELRFAACAEGTRITGQSQSRIGRGDLGQNKRNLREARAALSQLAAEPARAPAVQPPHARNA